MVSPKEKMIIVKLTGGLGNQMFQYAAGRAISLRAKTSLKLDISGYADDKFGRHYSLNVFNIKAALATSQEIKKLKPTENFLAQKSPRLSRLFSSLTKTYVNEDFSGGLIPENLDNIYLDGYWQDEKYFIEFTGQIKKDFKFKSKPNKNVVQYLKKINSSNSVCIHIRRADYVNNAKVRQSVGICGRQYYERAIKHISKRVMDPIFFVFSEPDGLEWAEKNLKFNYPHTLVKSGKDYEDLQLMSSCEHNIIANSSFSWWGAWLNTNPHKIVVAPEPWLNDKRTDIIPHDWFKVAKGV
ncbi:alpha-1,2-fucosyltransferase [Candidatus Gottesmanbacteria bacterium]|nr:alpha-1,2-fucosyltransferase [Candidatus Gottesmanbacteria bacterium]